MEAEGSPSEKDKTWFQKIVVRIFPKYKENQEKRKQARLERKKKAAERRATLIAARQARKEKRAQDQREAAEMRLRRRRKLAAERAKVDSNVMQQRRARAILAWLVIALIFFTFGWIVITFGCWNFLGFTPLVDLNSTTQSETSQAVVQDDANPVSSSHDTNAGDQAGQPEGAGTATGQTTGNDGAAETQTDSAAEPTTTAQHILLWCFSAWLGVTCYLLYNLQQWRRRMGPGVKNAADFITYSFWYFVTVLTAPFIAVVAMLLLSSAQINLGDANGATLNFAKLSPLLQSALAFMLGYFSRTTRQQLDLIMKSILPKAWVLTERRFSVEGPSSVLLGSTGIFKAEPPTDVVWDLPGATKGSISSGGELTAPSETTEDGKLIVVRGTLREDAAVVSTRPTVLRAVCISAGADRAAPKEVVALTLNNKTGLDLNSATWGSDYPGLVWRTTVPAAETPPVAEGAPTQPPAQPPASAPMGPTAQFEVPELGSGVTEKVIIFNASVVDADKKMYKAEPFRFTIQPGSADSGDGTDKQGGG